MIGRWAGALTAFNIMGFKKRLLLIIVPLVAFTVIIGVNTLANQDMTPLYYYVICIFIQIIMFFIAKDRPAFTLLIFGNRSEEHTSELQSRGHLVCRLLLEKKKVAASYLEHCFDFCTTFS